MKSETIRIHFTVGDDWLRSMVILVLLILLMEHHQAGDLLDELHHSIEIGLFTVTRSLLTDS